MNLFSLLRLWMLWMSHNSCTIFPLCSPLVSISSSSSFIALPHSRCCGPLGCLSTARSDFDICWNAQWSVQAWKDIQCFDPKPLVFFSSPFPFHQNLLCDIVHWYVGSQTKAWIYLNFHQWKTPPSHHYPYSHIHTSRTDDTYTQTHWVAHTSHWDAKTHKTWKRPSVKPQPLLQSCTFNETSIFYEHTKDNIAVENPLVVNLSSMKTITAPIIHKI